MSGSCTIMLNTGKEVCCVHKADGLGLTMQQLLRCDEVAAAWCGDGSCCKCTYPPFPPTPSPPLPPTPPGASGLPVPRLNPSPLPPTLPGASGLPVPRLTSWSLRSRQLWSCMRWRGCRHGCAGLSAAVA